ncbi:hypothetical protein VTG60DRAFT_3282 [Thermothelomyces hinnuleus]
MFDTYLAANPALEVQNNSILAEVASRFGTGDPTTSAYYTSSGCNQTSTLPALMITDAVLKEYAGQDHAGVAANAITDGIDYFVDL